MAVNWTDAISPHSRIAFDTNALAYFLEGQLPHSDRVGEALARMEQRQAAGFVSTLVELELLVRPLRQRDDQGVATVQKFFRLQPNLRLTPMDSTVAHAAAQVRAATGMRAPDAIIAATALIDRCDIIIGNDRAFARRSEVPYLLLDDFAA